MCELHWNIEISEKKMIFRNRHSRRKESLMIMLSVAVAVGLQLRCGAADGVEVQDDEILKSSSWYAGAEIAVENTPYCDRCIWIAVEMRCNG